MKTFEVPIKDGSLVTFEFPNSISEISSDYLKEITNSITVADNYTLVGLCYGDVLSRVILTARTGNKNAKIKVTPIFIKAGKTDIDYINNAKIKQKIIATQSTISLGVHINVPHHKLTLDYFVACVTNTSNKEIYNKELAKNDTRDCIFIEFKLVPNSEIMGLLDMDAPKVNKYVTIKQGKA